MSAGEAHFMRLQLYGEEAIILTSAAKIAKQHVIRFIDDPQNSLLGAVPIVSFHNFRGLSAAGPPTSIEQKHCK